MQERKYKDFFESYERFKKIENEQKARGLNDFNLLTAVLKYHDEVHLHSRMIGALLDPNGKHYQNKLFLQTFLKQIDLENWFENLMDVKIGIEYKDIDLYLTDGSKHLIIENKIWADDQPCQIMKYINIIVEKNEELKDSIEDVLIDKDNLLVLYLTPQSKRVPKKHTIKTIDGEEYITYQNNDDSLHNCSEAMQKKQTINFELQNYIACYKKITYKDHILPWLETSLNEIRNISNLSESISQYITVVHTVNNKTYKGNIMTLEDYMNENEDMYDYLQEIAEVKNKIEPEFWKELLIKLQSNQIISSKSYICKLSHKSEYKNKPEIKILPRSNSDSKKYVYIRRYHNTFYGYSTDVKLDPTIISEFGFGGNKQYTYTKPKINFKEFNDKFWEIAKPSQRTEVIEYIVKQVVKLVTDVDRLKLM